MFCPHCGMRNREGELICQVCGTMLVAPAATRHLKMTTGIITRTEARPRTGMLRTICFEIDGLSYDFPVKSGDTILVGRGRPEMDGVFSALDLMAIGGDEKGVSRKHAMVKVEGQTAFLVDLSSTNGTFLNGRRLQPQDRHLLCDNDTVRFGALESRIKLT